MVLFLYVLLGGGSCSFCVNMFACFIGSSCFVCSLGICVFVWCVSCMQSFKAFCGFFCIQ